MTEERDDDDMSNADDKAPDVAITLQRIATALERIATALDRGIGVERIDQ